MKNLKFLKDPRSQTSDGNFVAHLSEINNKKELLDQLSEKLLFPDYFGFNWDALDECINDFHWIKQKEIILIHDDLPKLDVNELKIYLGILVDAIKNWKKTKEHCFEVIFPENIKRLISQGFTY